MKDREGGGMGRKRRGKRGGVSIEWRERGTSGRGALGDVKSEK